MSDSSSELLARLCADQHERWQAGQRILVEEFLTRYPALESDDEGLVALIVGLARVAAGLHFPSDVLGSALLAALPAAAGLSLETALAGTPLVRRATGQGLGEERST